METSLKNANKREPESSRAQDDELVASVLLEAYQKYWWNPETKAALMALDCRGRQGTFTHERLEKMAEISSD